MLLPFDHEVVARGLHRFRFPSQSRKGVVHQVLVDLDAPPGERIHCLCEASLHGRMCKHKRFLITGHPGPWLRPRPRSGQRR